MVNKKKTIVANFNLVFSGENDLEQPLLEYFDVVVGAFKQEDVIKLNGTQYLLMNVDVINTGEDDYAIVGCVVKDTTLEVFSELNEKGQLIGTDNIYPAAPFSFFCIYLKNHRMILVQNQKGSPTLRNFAAVAYRALSRYINLVNGNKEDDDSKIPQPELNVVGIPMRESIEATLKKVKSINSLTLRFYPLNGDIDYSSMFTGMTVGLRKKVGSKNGSLTLRSPKNIEGIAEILAGAGGTVDPVFEVTYPGNIKKTIHDSQISERMEMDVQGKNIEEGLKDIVSKGKEIDAISYVSNSNREIFKENKNKIIPFVSKK